MSRPTSQFVEIDHATAIHLLEFIEMLRRKHPSVVTDVLGRTDKSRRLFAETVMKVVRAFNEKSDQPWIPLNDEDSAGP